ncbi:MAG: tRNA pseudouridine(55) synthase TruB [Sulfuricurvum sp.]
MNRLFVANKPAGVGSNKFLGSLKRKYGVKKAGFSGTLDPFANGVLVVAFGSYTKLFRFLKTAPKRYRATLWLGANSITLDSEMIDRVDSVKPLGVESISSAVASLEGELSYIPPRFSAKHIDGKRAYDLARSGEEFELDSITSSIYEAKLISYMHPFVTFEVVVSSGSYVRSIGLELAKRVGVSSASLSYLTRLSEGAFVYDGEKSLYPKEYLDLKPNRYLGDIDNLRYGRVLNASEFELMDDGYYFVEFDDALAVLRFSEGVVKYELGRVEC